MAVEQDENAGATEYNSRTVTTNAWLLEELLRSFIGDPFELLQPRPAGRGYWGEGTDQGITMTEEDGHAVKFIAWADLRDIVCAVKATRVHTVRRAAAPYQDRIQRVEPTPEGMTHEEMDRINELEMWGPSGRPKLH
jgi:hypothetical protein